jgi:hypothetical protein
MKTLGQLRSVVSGPDAVGENEQGFLSNKGNFYDRFESMRLAIESEQVEYDKLYNPRIGLFSEDLY